MLYWLELGTSPPVGVYPDGTDPALLPNLPALQYPALLSVGARRSSARIGGAGESGNLDLEIADTTGTLRALLTERPTGYLATVYYLFGGERRTFFAGRVESASLAVDMSLSLVAMGMTDPLPLRSTTAWARYRTVATLPLVIGECRIEPIPYDAAGLWWLLADHPIESVSEVKAGDRSITAYALHQQADETGHPVALLELAEKPRDNERLAVSLRGLPDPATGSLLLNPADVIWYLVNEIAGSSIARSDLADFRHECDAEGLEIHGVLRDAQQSIGSVIASLSASIGAVWANQLPSFARLWPLDSLPADEPILASYDHLTSWNYQHTAARSELATVLRVMFDRDDFDGKHRQAVTLEAPEAIAEHGRVEKEIDAGWLRSSRLASALGTRLLRWQARTRWAVTLEADPTVGAGFELAPGVAVTLDPVQALSAEPVLLADAVADLGQNRLTLSTEMAVGALPRVVQTQLSTALDQETSQARLVFKDGIAEISVVDGGGLPVAGAQVSLGPQTMKSDGAGMASFLIAAGTYELLIIHPDGTRISMPDFKVG